ncbi:unnamed protein product, partial [Musa textilis]
TEEETSDSVCISDASPRLRRKWKDLVDGWVKSNSAGDSTASPAILDGDSPSQHLGKNHQNGHQVLDLPIDSTRILFFSLQDLSI